jgi:hypothetical protein
MIFYNQIPVSPDAVQIYYSDRPIHPAEKMRRILQLDNIDFCMLQQTEATAARTATMSYELLSNKDEFSTGEVTTLGCAIIQQARGVKPSQPTH